MLDITGRSVVVTEGLRLAPRAAFPCPTGISFGQGGPVEKLLFDGHGKARTFHPPGGRFRASGRPRP
ncbi:protein of unknown function [Denitratisoma oestradiolicum]|uniref:Uncharacterized protein n=1 Tax=Denitratisoma oestradiolicum TaxID=311182 RepID=A0A6S6YJ80_9PROT|nr:protein of unknown function [Denitratisoma oestradiolicum]